MTDVTDKKDGRGARICRECRTEVSGITYLQLGGNPLKGHNSICLSCVEKGMSKMLCKSVRDWVLHYMTGRHKPSGRG